MWGIISRDVLEKHTFYLQKTFGGDKNSGIIVSFE